MAMRPPRMSRISSPLRGKAVMSTRFWRTGIAEDDLAARDAGILRQQPHHGLNGDRFSGTGFADDRQGAASVEVEIHVAQRMHDARFAGEIDGEVADAQDAMVAGHPCVLPKPRFPSNE